MTPGLRVVLPDGCLATVTAVRGDEVDVMQPELLTGAGPWPYAMEQLLEAEEEYDDARRREVDSNESLGLSQGVWR